MIVYEPHPVSPERKAELRAKGFTIIDAVFAPEGAENGIQAQDETETAPPAPVKPRGRPRKAAD